MALYGTIIVDLERREPIEVFAGREKTAVAAWMRAHPSIEIVARDRAGAYSEAVDIALPAARQVSDRWHLLCNPRDNVERGLLPAGTEFTVPSINELSYPGEWTHIALPVRQRIGRMFRKEVDGRLRTTFASGFARIQVTAGKNELGQTIYKTFTA
ncbi:transposase [Cupriavidus sp. 8B]